MAGRLVNSPNRLPNSRRNNSLVGLCGFLLRVGVLLKGKIITPAVGARVGGENVVEVVNGAGHRSGQVAVVGRSRRPCRASLEVKLGLKGLHQGRAEARRRRNASPNGRLVQEAAGHRLARSKQPLSCQSHRQHRGQQTKSLQGRRSPGSGKKRQAKNEVSPPLICSRARRPAKLSSATS